MTRVLSKCCSNYCSLEGRKMDVLFIFLFSFRPVKSSEKDDRVSQRETLHCVTGIVSRLHKCERSRTFPPSVTFVHTKFYGSARRRLLHQSFLFAPGKYLTPYSDSSLVFLYISTVLIVRSIHRPLLMFVAYESSGKAFVKPIDRMLHHLFRYFDQMSPFFRVLSLRRSRNPRWSRQIRDTDSTKPLRRTAQSAIAARICVCDDGRIFLSRRKKAQLSKCMIIHSNDNPSRK